MTVLGGATRKFPPSRKSGGTWALRTPLFAKSAKDGAPGKIRELQAKSLLLAQNARNEAPGNIKGRGQEGPRHTADAFDLAESLAKTAKNRFLTG